MNKIYKYSSMESAIKIINKGSVLLNEPSKFNDPFDSKIVISEEDKEKCLELIYNYNLFVIFEDFVNRNDLKLHGIQRLLIGFVRLEVSCIKKMIKKRKKYEKIPFFNKIKKYFMNVSEDYAESIAESKNKFYNETIPKIIEIYNKARISCFSKRNDSILMWSHYANSHSGVCFEFEEDRPFFKEVNYSDDKVKLDIYSAIQRVLASSYLGEQLSYTDKEFSKIMLEPFFCKSKDWEYEQEIRCLLSNQESNTEGFYVDPYTIKEMLKMKITKIYVGTKAHGKILDELIYKAQNRGIPVIFMKEDEEKYLIVPDNDKKANVNKYDSKQKNNCIEMLVNDVKTSIENEAFIAALNTVLIIPSILGQIAYPNLSKEEAYVKWYQDNIGTYDRNPENEKTMPYLSGDLVYKLKNAIQEDGNSIVTGQYKDFSLTDFQFIVEQKNVIGIYADSSCVGESRCELEISIRNFCSKVLYHTERFMEDYKDEIDKLECIMIRRLDRELEELEEFRIRMLKQKVVAKINNGE